MKLQKQHSSQADSQCTVSQINHSYSNSGFYQSWIIHKLLPSQLLVFYLTQSFIKTVLWDPCPTDIPIWYVLVSRARLQSCIAIVSEPGQAGEGWDSGGGEAVVKLWLAKIGTAWQKEAVPVRLLSDSHPSAKLCRPALPDSQRGSILKWSVSPRRKLKLVQVWWASGSAGNKNVVLPPEMAEWWNNLHGNSSIIMRVATLLSLQIDERSDQHWDKAVPISTPVCTGSQFLGFVQF